MGCFHIIFGKGDPGPGLQDADSLRIELLPALQDLAGKRPLRTGQGEAGRLLGN